MGFNILVLSQTDLFIKLLEDVLDKDDFDLESLSTPKQLFLKDGQRKFNLLISTENTGDISPFQLFYLLKHHSRYQNIPVIFFADLSEKANRLHYSFYPVNAVVSNDINYRDSWKGIIQKILKQDPKKKMPSVYLNEKNLLLDSASLPKDSSVPFLYSHFYNSILQKLKLNTLLNELNFIEREKDSLEETVKGILTIYAQTNPPGINIMIIQERLELVFYVLPSQRISGNALETLLWEGLEKISDLIPGAQEMDLREVVFNKNSISQDDNDINDVFEIKFFFPLKDAGKKSFAVLLYGNHAEDSIQGSVIEGTREFASRSALILRNTLDFQNLKARNRQIKQVFSRFLPTEIINDLIKKKTDKALMVGEKRSIVVFFIKIQNFKVISEKNPADKVVFFLNRHFSYLGDIIKKHGGSINKFIGDALFALFGAPVSYEDNANRAVKAALEIIEAMKMQNMDDIHFPEGGYQIGIGINQGSVIIGNIGCSDKFDYTAIGDTVNLAARIEGLTSYYKQSVIISDTVREELSEEAFGFRFLDRVRVKGKDKVSNLYAVSSLQDALNEEALDFYNKAVKMYLLGNWLTAISYFEAAAKSLEDDFICQLFISRCREFLQKQPVEWDGAITLTFK